ncbi:thioredoxin family protein [Olivibacter domesticus]|uniref:Thioredoxin n=1 Tax=Olivibacter domesticus TaxID=407022 RepID=A0A1H7WT04_OLID1|nr:thioredoxin fold domain-containing protein [Olivibacter domesticus]SEM24662.1 Thioredoxin [Olivibacter domesticus]
MKQIKINTYVVCLGFFLLSLLPSWSLKAQQRSSENTGIIFSNQSFKKMLVIARASHKNIFVDAYAIWCAPCKQLQKTTFKDAKAAAYFNKNFINIRIDVEKGEGIDLAKKWQVEGLPTLLILDEKGEIIADHTGYVDGTGLLEFAKEVTGKE